MNPPPVAIYMGGWGIRLSSITKAAVTKIFLPMPIIKEKEKKSVTLAGELNRVIYHTLLEIIDNPEDEKIFVDLDTLGILESAGNAAEITLDVLAENAEEYVYPILDRIAEKRGIDEDERIPFGEVKRIVLDVVDYISTHEGEISERATEKIKERIKRFQERYSKKLVERINEKIKKAEFSKEEYPVLWERVFKGGDNPTKKFWEAWRGTCLVAEPYRMLRSFGIKKIFAIVSQDQKEWFKAVCGGLRSDSIEFKGIFEKKRRETGGALAEAFKQFGKLNLDDEDPVVCMSGDIWFNFFLRPIVDAHRKIQSERDEYITTVVFYEIPEDESYRFGVVGKEGLENLGNGIYRVRTFIEKPARGSEEWEKKFVSGKKSLINAGITIYSYGMWKEIEEIDRSYGDKKWREADVLLTKLADEGRLFGYNTGVQRDIIHEFDNSNLYWADLGTIGAYEKELRNWGINIIPLYRVIERGPPLYRKYALSTGLIW
ncbi:MAG: nucleotidyltransferase family protein [Candidatus Syntropharchaeia archaeon]